MKNYYFNQKGMTSLKMWMYALALEDIEANPSYSKRSRLYEFATTTKKYLKRSGDDIELRDIGYMIQKTQLKNKYLGKSWNPHEAKVWLYKLAFTELKHAPNKEKLLRLRELMGFESSSIQNSSSSIAKIEFLKIRTEVESMINTI